MSTKKGYQMDATFSSPKNARRESETSGGEPGAPDGGAAFNALGEELLQRITEGPRLCPSRLPEHTNSTWRKQIMRGTGAKARMRENRPEGSFAVSVDERYGNGNFMKSFTFFDSAADLFRQTAHLPQKSFYELIEADRWARLYFDIEHYVDSEAVPSGIEGAVQAVKEQLIHTWPEKFQDTGHVIEDVIILIASRYVDVIVDGCDNGTGTGKYKHSYHVIFPQIYFYGNYGLMKQFVHSLQGDPMLQARGKNGEPICMIDGNVYHRDQPFRLIESCKLVDGPPRGVLRPIAASGPISMTELLRTVVTHDEGDGIRIGEESSGRLDVSSGQAARKKRALSVSADNQDDQDPPTRKATKRTRTATSMPTACIEDFQQMMEQTGIKQCVMTEEVIWKDGYAVLPLRNTGPRPCILSANTTHDSNNAFLTVNSDRIVFKCQSDKCKGRSKCLGAPPASWGACCRGSAFAREESYAHLIVGGDVGSADSMQVDTNNGPHEMEMMDTRRANQMVSDGRERHSDHYGDTDSDHVSDNGVNSAVSCQSHENMEPDQVEMRDSCAPYRHEITPHEVLQILDHLSMAVDLSPTLVNTTSEPQKGILDLSTVAAILKRFKYEGVWRQWSAKHVDSQEERDQIWRQCDEGCTKDLNDIVRAVNVANGKTSRSKIGPVERVYFDQPALSQQNSARITSCINAPYLDQAMFEKRVVVVQSCTGTGKSTQAVALAQLEKMPILSVCPLRSQVQKHVEDFRQNGLSTVPYDDADACRAFRPGEDSLVTTVDSLPKVIRLLKESVSEYIVLFDEFHSTMNHIHFSHTLQQTRREAVKTMRWLTVHAGKLIAMDNEITDIELKFLDDALAGDTDSVCDLTFIKNEFQKFKNVPVRYTIESEMFDGMLQDMKDGNGFTVPCNTKKQAERIHVLLQAMTTDNPALRERFKLYTSDQGKAPADVDTEWSKNWVVYSHC